MTLPAYTYGNPLDVLIAKESGIERKVKKCFGCQHLITSARDGQIMAVCGKGLKVGRKSCILRSGHK